MVIGNQKTHHGGEELKRIDIQEQLPVLLQSSGEFFDGIVAKLLDKFFIVDPLEVINPDPSRQPRQVRWEDLGESSHVFYRSTR